jgi:hypothetical protein
MRRTLFVLLAVVALVIVAMVGLVYTDNVVTVSAFIFKPHHGWDAALKASPPDYADTSSWAALPSKPGLTSYIPEGAPPAAKDAAVDVFFVHPTGFLTGADWNSNLASNTQTEENTQWMMANQASAFNGCCNIYAPRYREASIFTYFSAPPDLFKKTMDLAYSDVDRAFTYFLAHYSHGRPFILASHSQGTFHAFRLIRERIDGTPLANRLVAAYLLGGGITNKEIAQLKTVHACDSPTDLHCVNHWATWGEGGSPYIDGKDRLLCVNPLTWKRDGGPAPANLHEGGVPPSGRFQIRPWNESASGVQFPPLGKPVKAWTTARCQNGILYVDDQKGGPFEGLDLGRKNYHGLDYPLFHMDIRENAEMRVRAYLSQTAVNQ